MLFAFLPFCIFAFSLLPFCFFTFVIMRQPKTISLQVGRKVADKSKEGVMTKVLRVLAGLDVKALQVAYEVVRVTFASPELFRAAKWFTGKHLFGLWCSILEGGPPIMRVHVFDFTKRMTYPWRLLSRSMVQSSLSKSRLFFPIKTSLMVPGLLMLPFLGYYPAFWWWTGIYVVCGIVVNPWFAIFVPLRTTDRQTALTRTSAQSVGKPGTLLGIVPLPGQQETLASSLQSAEANVSHDSPHSQLLKDNELDLLQSQSILPDLVALSGDSSDAEFNQRASKRVGKTRALLPKRVILLQALLSKFVLQAAKSLTLLLPILLN